MTRFSRALVSTSAISVVAPALVVANPAPSHANLLHADGQILLAPIRTPELTQTFGFGASQVSAGSLPLQLLGYIGSNIGMNTSASASASAGYGAARQFEQ